MRIREHAREEKERVRKWTRGKWCQILLLLLNIFILIVIQSVGYYFGFLNQ